MDNTETSAVTILQIIKEFLEHETDDTRNIALLKDFYMGKSMNTVTGTFDIDAVSRMFIDSPTWHVCPGFSDGGTYSGINEVFRTFYSEKIPKLFATGLYAIPEVFIDGGDVVSVLGFGSMAKIAPDAKALYEEIQKAGLPYGALNRRDWTD